MIDQTTNRLLKSFLNSRHVPLRLASLNELELSKNDLVKESYNKKTRGREY
jgi:hypothetical protein